MPRWLDWVNGAPSLEQREETPPTPDSPTPIITLPSRDASSRSVDVNDAFTLSMVYRAIQIITVSTKQISLDAYRGSQLVAPEPALIRAPNVDEPRSVFIEETTVSLATNGNAYWMVERNSAGRAINLTVLDPLQVEIQSTDWGRTTSYQYKGKEYRPDQIKHLKMLRRPGQPKGLGPIQAAQIELRGAMDVRDYAGNWFHKSGLPAGGYLSSDQIMGTESAKQYKKAWTEGMAERDGVPVLGNGLKFNETFLNPRDALWLESQQFNTTQIARLFGVPSSLMLAQVEGGTQSYQNVSQDWLGFTRYSLTGYLTEIEEALSSLLPGGTNARFNVEALLRSDTTTRYAAHSVAIGSGFMTRNEVRAIENLPALPEFDAPAPAPAPEEVDE